MSGSPNAVNLGEWLEAVRRNGDKCKAACKRVSGTEAYAEAYDKWHHAYEEIQAMPKPGGTSAAAWDKYYNNLAKLRAIAAQDLVKLGCPMGKDGTGCFPPPPEFNTGRDNWKGLSQENKLRIISMKPRSGGRRGTTRRGRTTRRRRSTRRAN